VKTRSEQWFVRFLLTKLESSKKEVKKLLEFQDDLYWKNFMNRWRRRVKGNPEKRP